MARTTGQKTKMLTLCRLLLSKTDEEHPISTPKLIEALEREEIPAERKSVYADMKALQDFGLDIQFRKGKDGGWFVGEREFQLPELKLLVDAVQSSRFISHKKSGELIRKLEGLASEHQAKQLRRQVYVDGRVKTGNENVYYAIDKLHTAIAAGKAVSFQYFDYNGKKEKAFRREGKRYMVSPYGLIWSDEYYYLVGLDHQDTGDLRCYRVDRMSSLTVTGCLRVVTEETRDFDLAEYGQKHFNMFAGREAKVRLRCEERMVNAVLDRFGLDVMLIPDGEGYFSLTVDAVVSPQFYGWLFGLGTMVRITAPGWAVEEYQDMLTKAMK